MVLLAPVLFARPLLAQSLPETPAAPDTAAATDSSAQARPHFDKARELYRTGAYREAIRELEVARTLEGARREIAPLSPAAPASTDPAAAPEPDASPASTDDKGGRGRLDGATLTAGGVMLVGIGVGTAFGIKALADRPNGFVTGQDGSFADFQHRNDVAHGEAIVADASLGVGIVAAVVTAFLYFARDSAPDPPTGVSASWLLGGGDVGLRGTF
jgi:hypothetical protein